MKFPPQIVRIAFLTALIVLSFLGGRYLLTPDSFGEHGFYRGAALEEAADKKLHFAGKAACIECHGDIYELLIDHGHGAIACESCHGPGLNHAEDPTLTLSATRFKKLGCLGCHSEEIARPDWQVQINPEEHYGDDCNECHTPHDPDNF